MDLKNKSRGFTLIEIIFVLILLSVLAAIAVAKFQDAKEEAEVAIASAMIVNEANGGINLLEHKNLITTGSKNTPLLASLTSGSRPLDLIVNSKGIDESGVQQPGLDPGRWEIAGDCGIEFTSSYGNKFCFGYNEEDGEFAAIGEMNCVQSTFAEVACATDPDTGEEICVPGPTTYVCN